ncbi:MAG: hypothetical protein ACXACU_14820 [Candidatus Hodarchaeales archaeon]
MIDLPSEEELVNHLDNILVEKLKFQTYTELQITSKFVDIQNLTPTKQNQLRIDLAAISQIDGSIHFFEAENQIHTQHPTIYSEFCDYCYLLCPEEQFDFLDSVTKRQQLSWAEEAGVGIVTISKKGELRVRLHAKLQDLKLELRKEVIRMMDKRFKIRFLTRPLWERSRNPHSNIEV